MILYNSLNIQIERTDVYLVDLLISIPEIKIVVTLLVVAGFTHATNIVDGFNGLAAGLLIFILFGLGWLAWTYEDKLIFQLILINLSVLVGFFILNWPFGKIFLGDSGAYLMGFVVVNLGILLVNRNTEISPMAPVVLGLIPLNETLFSIYRRIFLQKKFLHHPDALHLHTLLYRRILFKRYKNSNSESANSLVSLLLFMPALILLILTLSCFKSTTCLLIIMISYLFCYIYIYKNIVLFKTSRIFIIKSLVNRYY